MTNIVLKVTNIHSITIGNETYSYGGTYGLAVNEVDMAALKALESNGYITLVVDEVPVVDTPEVPIEDEVPVADPEPTQEPPEDKVIVEEVAEEVTKVDTTEAPKEKKSRKTTK